MRRVGVVVEKSHIRLPGEDMGIAGVDRQGDQGPQRFGQLSGGPAGTPPNHGRAWPLPSRRVRRETPSVACHSTQRQGELRC